MAVIMKWYISKYISKYIILLFRIFYLDNIVLNKSFTRIWSEGGNGSQCVQYFVNLLHCCLACSAMAWPAFILEHSLYNFVQLCTAVSGEQFWDRTTFKFCWSSSVSVMSSSPDKTGSLSSNTSEIKTVQLWRSPLYSLADWLTDLQI